MSENTILFETPVTISELRTAIPLYGTEITPVITGEPGIGKSTLLKILQKDLGDGYDYVYVDCPTWDVSDVGMRIPVHSSKSLEFYVAEVFKKNSSKPKVIMLDEWLKSPKMLKIIFTRAILEREVGDWQLPPGSIVFATSNNASDLVGDSIQAHQGNRVMFLRMQKPTAEEWLPWATDNKISAVIRAWVHMEPSCLASYLDGDSQKDNPYIFFPGRHCVSFVTPRSLAKADIVIRNRTKVSESMTKAALAGTIGAPAAESMAAFISLEKEITHIKDVLKDPLGVPVPTKPAAVFMMIFNALSSIEVQEDLSAFLQFMDRVDSREVEAVLFTMLVKTERTVKMALANQRIKDWAHKNIDLF